MIFQDEVRRLLEETDGMLAFMWQSVSIDEPEVIARRLTDINVYLARSAYILSQAQYIKECQEEEILSTVDRALKATEIKRIISAATKETSLLLSRTELVNHDLVHQGNNLRKQLSYTMGVTPREL